MKVVSSTSRKGREADKGAFWLIWNNLDPEPRQAAGAGHGGKGRIMELREVSLLLSHSSQYASHSFGSSSTFPTLSALGEEGRRR
jgi:hypothetical protein